MTETIEMGLIDCNDPLLKTEMETFDFSNPPVDPEELAIALVDFMRESNGIGLAANQVGLPYRAFAMEGEPALVCFNPKIVMPGEETVVLEEGCLTYPNIFVKIKRAKTIKVRFQGPDGEVYTKTFSGMTARVFQHELDHLNGVNYMSRANVLQREKAMKQLKKLRRTG